MTAARAGTRSVVTSSGSSWTASIRTKNLRAAAKSRQTDTRTSMTWPCSSTARYTYSHTPSDFHIGLVDEPADTCGVAARAGGLDGQRGVKCWAQPYSVTWSTSMPRSASRSSRSRYDSPKRRYHRTASTITSDGNL
jgi:hypothetical protein